MEPNVIAFKRFIITKRKIEYSTARKKRKLSKHFKKWAFGFKLIFYFCNVHAVVL